MIFTTVYIGIFIAYNFIKEVKVINNYRDDYRVYALRFGEVAVMKKFITTSQMEEAFSEQVSSYPSTLLRPHKLIGEILLEKRWMTFEQVLTVLEELTRQQKARSVAIPAKESCLVISYSLPDQTPFSSLIRGR